ncbi:hypothetical protein JKP88DRAFT_262250 [Tribonema minus]|uniref:PX domain-containing protein n=1 Tax=Tribonema minus TaxID=303371 RepID=A0A835ZBW2_9STRA|nr:hypothetical protein JKP88DRAFT_262250 [Tribonema minus]
MSSDSLESATSCDVWLPGREAQLANSTRSYTVGDVSSRISSIGAQASFVGDVVYSAAPLGSAASQQPLRKVSFRHGSFATAPRDRGATQSSEFGWYDLDGDSEECDGEDLSDGQLHAVDVIARWHEVGGHLARAAAANPRPLDSPSSSGGGNVRVLKRVLIRDYVISTRSFAAPKRPSATMLSSLANGGGGGARAGGGKRGLSTSSTTPLGSACALAALQDERAATDAAPVCFAWAIPEIRILKGPSSSKEYAEYLVVGCLGDTILTSWRRYSDLMEWAEDAKELKFARAVEAWEGVTGGKRIFRCVEPSYLRMKSYNLEHFLQQLLFEVSSYTELLQFFDKEKAQGQNPQGDVVLIQPLANLPISPSLLSQAIPCPH